MPHVTFHAGFKHAMRCVAVSDVEALVESMEAEGWTFLSWEPASTAARTENEDKPVVLAFTRPVDALMIDARPIMQHLERCVEPISNLSGFPPNPLDRDDEKLVASGKLKAYKEILEILHRRTGS